MSHAPGTYLGGIRTLEDIHLRCYVDPRSDCWHWRLHFSSRGRSCCVWTVDGIEHKGTAARAAWVLAGYRLEPGWIVSRRRSICDSPDCCNPAHHRAGPRAKVLPKMTPEQRVMHRVGVTRASRRSAKLTMEAALRIRQSDAPCHEEAAKWGVAPTTISQIRRGETWRTGFLGGAA